MAVVVVFGMMAAVMVVKRSIGDIFGEDLDSVGVCLAGEVRGRLVGCEDL